MLHGHVIGTTEGTVAHVPCPFRTGRSPSPGGMVTGTPTTAPDLVGPREVGKGSGSPVEPVVIDQGAP